MKKIIPAVLATTLIELVGAEPVSGLSGDLSWTGRERHPAVVNPVCRPADDPDALSLAGTRTFAAFAPHHSFRCSSLATGKGWWGENPQPIRVPGCWEASGAIPGVAMIHPWNCHDRAELMIRGYHLGEGLYRRTVTIPAAWKGKRIWFKPGWVNSVGSFWIDGKAVAMEFGKNVVSLSGQFGGPNILLGWWWMGSQMGSVLNDHPWLDGFPHRGVFSPLFFRIGKSGLKMPVAGVSEKNIVMVGEGQEACYLYLAETRSRAGGRVCHIAGLDVLTDTPEGTTLLDGALRRCR